MRLLLPCLALAAAALALPATAQTPAWTGGAQSVNPTPTNNTDAEGAAIAADAAGNAYVAGVLGNDNGGTLTRASRTFGPTTLTAQGTFVSGVLAKLSPAQQWLWAVGANSTGEGASFEYVALSAAGDVYAAGDAEENDLLFPNGGPVVSVGSFTYTTVAAESVFLTRLNAATGQPQWLVGLPRTDIRRMQWDAVAGNLVVVGEYYDGLTIGSTVLPAAPQGGFFVARLSAAGQWLSALGVTLTGTSNSTDLDFSAAAVGPQGQVAVNFSFRSGTLTLGSTVVTSTGTNTADEKIVMAQLSPAGQWQWVTQPTRGLYSPHDLEYDRTGGGLWLLGGAGTNPSLQFGPDIVPNGYEFLARISSTGSFQNVYPIASTNPNSTNSTSETYSLTVDGQNHAIVVGRLGPGSTTTFSGADRVLTLMAGNAVRTYVARRSPNFTGDWTYAQLAPLPVALAGSTDAGRYYIEDAALDGAGNLLGVGDLLGSLTLGATTLTSSRGGDLLVARLSSAGTPVAVRQPAGAPRLALFPNPVAAGRAATLRLPAPTKAALPVRLRDALGRTVRAATLPAGQQQLNLPTAGLAPGLYQLEAGLSRAQIVIE